MIIVIKYEN